MEAIFWKGILLNNQIIPAWTIICAIQQGKRDLSCFFSIFTRISGPRRLFYTVACVEELSLLCADFHLPLSVLWSYVLYSTWIRVTWTTGMAWITRQIYYTRETPLDNLVKGVTLACGHMQEDPLHRRVGGCAEQIGAFHILVHDAISCYIHY